MCSDPENRPQTNPKKLGKKVKHITYINSQNRINQNQIEPYRSSVKQHDPTADFRARGLRSRLC